MSTNNKVSDPVDVWGRLHTLFEGSSDELSEIHFVNMTDDQLAACLIYLMRYSREVISHFRFSGTKTVVDVASPETAIRAIVKGTISAAFWIEFPCLPSIALHIESPDMMSVSYMRGEWTAQTVLAFFDLMHQFKTIAPSIEVVPGTGNFTFEEQAAFMEVWQEFHDAAS